MKRNAAKSFARYYSIAQFQYFKNEIALARSKDLILVYTMAKVGSISYYNSIKSSTKKPVLHIHSLDQNRVDSLKKDLKIKGLFPDSRSNIPSVLKHVQNKKVKIISAVRNPLERNVSAFFEVLEYYLKGEKDTDTIADLTRIYHKKLWHSYPLEWFDDEIKQWLDIDVYAQVFDFDKKHATYQKNNCEVLVLRTDLENTSKQHLIEAFLGQKMLPIQNQNDSQQKYYSKLYERFKKEVHFSDAYINEMCDHHFTKHFYSKDEIKALKSRWSNPTNTNYV